MVDIVKLADEVAKNLSDLAKAEVMFAPELELKGLKELRLIVVPTTIVMKPIARTTSEDTFKIHVGVLKKCTEDDVNDLIKTVILIGRRFLDVRLGGATCVEVGYDPLYSADHLRERRQFTGIVELTFKAVSRNGNEG